MGYIGCNGLFQWRCNIKKIGCEGIRRTLGSLLTQVGFCGERVIITRNFKEVAVMISWDDWKMIEKMFREIDEKRQLKE